MPDERAADPILAAVDLLAPAFEASGLEELEVRAGELHVRLTRPRGSAVAVVEPSHVPPGEARSTAQHPFGTPAPGLRFVSAPLTGVWYASPSPGARPYIVEGSEIAAGQVVGLIEAMKLFNEIKSDTGGTVTRILVENGTLVKRQQPLLEVRP